MNKKIDDDRMDAVLADMTEYIYRVNRDNGWYDEARTFGEGISLIHSEVSEMLEAYREHGLKDATAQFPVGYVEKDEPMPLPKPEGVGSEAADVLIRLLDECNRQGIDLGFEFRRKMEYNKTRGYRHGNKIL